MIAYISGNIIGKKERTVVVEVNGIGYLVFVTRSFNESIQLGEKTSLHIHTHVREDAISLYGFAAQEELAFFELLLSVSGVGPKYALEISNYPLAKVKQAIATKETAYLTKIPGIGRKTAERIIVDLQGKIKEDILVGNAETTAGSEEIVQALMSLGYHRNQVMQGLKKIPHEIEGEEAVIKYFLQNI